MLTKRPRVRILQYGPSNGARELSHATDIIRLKWSGTKFVPRAGDIIVNWGASESPFDHPVTWINHPDRVRVASSKLLSLQAMQKGGVNVPEFTTEPERARSWLSEGGSVVARTLDRASGGRGIVLLTGQDKLPQARLYTLYIPKYDEYRVHVWGDEVIDVQQKRKRKDYDGERCIQIRNFARGWVFCRDGINPPAVVLDEARKAVRSLGLDFGAVDVGFTRKGSRATVYEVNTAPGIEGGTVGSYSRKLLKNLGDLYPGFLRGLCGNRT